MRRGQGVVIVLVMMAAIRMVVTMVMCFRPTRTEPSRQMQVMRRVVMVMAGQPVLPMRMMRTAAEQQVQAEGKQR